MISRNWLIGKRGSLSQQEVSERAGIDRSFYTQIETGTRNPSVNTAKKIAGTLGFDWTLFFKNECGESPQMLEQKVALLD